MATVGGKGLFKVMASAVLAERVGQFLSQIVRGVEGKGWTFENGDGGLKLIADGEPIAFELVEQTDRVPHVQTEKETAALLKFEEQRARALRTRTYFSEWDKPKIPDWDHRPSGRLTLKFEAGYHHHRLRRSFSDGKRQRLETMIDAILEAFVAFADGEKAWRVEQERRRLQAIEDEKRRRERERIETLETKRREFLKHQLVWHEDAKAVEDFVASFGPDAHQDPAVGAFLAWAKGYAGRLRNQISVATLRGKLEKYDLMNDAATISSWTTVT